MDKNKTIKVRNRDNGYVGYTVNDLNIRRDFSPNEVKELTFEEIQKLSYQDGGMALISTCLLIEDEEAIKELYDKVEPEYYYTEKEVKTLLESGSIAQLEDCLDFAPEGVINLIKDIAVKISLSDMNKREAIFKKTGFNVTNAINVVKIQNEDNNGVVEEGHKTRRAEPIATAPTPASIPQPPTYKVISK